MTNGFTYRGQHSSVLGLNLLSYKLNSPELREYEDDVAGRHGTIDYGTEFGKRDIEIRVDVLSSNEPLKVRASKILKWLDPTKGEADLIFDELPDWTFKSKYTGKLGIDQMMQYGEFGITMKCRDPFAHEEATDAQTLKYDTGIQYDSGLMYPNETVMSVIARRQRMFLQNRGFQDVFPIVTFTGSGFKPRLTINGKKVGTNDALKAGDVWEVDTLNGVIRKNGIVSLLSWADFSPIPIDGCECIFEIENGSGTLRWQYDFLHL